MKTILILIVVTGKELLCSMNAQYSNIKISLLLIESIMHPKIAL
jgi:hypothetical protein